MVSWTHDQAAGLRQLFTRGPRPVVAFLGVEPADSSLTVLHGLLDLARRGLPSIAIDETGAEYLYGGRSSSGRLDLADAMARRSQIEHVTSRIERNALVLPASKAMSCFPGWSLAQRKSAAALIRTAERQCAVTLIDAMVYPHTLSPLACGAARHVICVPVDASGLRAGFLLLKLLRTQIRLKRCGLVITRAGLGVTMGRHVDNFCAVVRGSLDIDIEWIATLSQPGLSWLPSGETLWQASSARLIGDYILQSTATTLPGGSNV